MKTCAVCPFLGWVGTALFLLSMANAHALQINRTSNSILLIDTGNGVYCSYASYQIVNNDAANHTNLWVKADTFSGTIVSLGGGDPGQYSLGNLGVGQTNTAFFYLQATNATAAEQTHNIKVFRGRPDIGTLLLTASFSLTVDNAGQNASSKIDGASVSPNPPTLGGLFTITLTGNSGTIGGANTINFTPAVLTNWDASAYQLVSSHIIAAGGNAGSYSNTLFVTFASSANTLFTNTYWFRAVGMAGSNSISPLFTESGGGVSTTICRRPPLAQWIPYAPPPTRPWYQRLPTSASFTPMKPPSSPCVLRTAVRRRSSWIRLWTLCPPGFRM